MKISIKSILFLLFMISASCQADNDYPVKSFKTDSGKNVEITMIKHGSLAISYEDTQILIDPVANFYGQIVDLSGFKPNSVFITHEHGDHLDANLLSTFNQNVNLYLNATSQKQINKGNIVNNGDTVTINQSIHVIAIPAYNTTSGREKFHPKGNGNGYLFEIDGLRIYISGDTEDIPEMQDIQDVDVAFLSANQPYTMTVEQCVRAAKLISPKHLIPYHLGETNVTQIADMLKNTNIKVHLFDTLK